MENVILAYEGVKGNAKHMDLLSRDEIGKELIPEFYFPNLLVLNRSQKPDSFSIRHLTYNEGTWPQGYLVDEIRSIELSHNVTGLLDSLNFPRYTNDRFGTIGRARSVVDAERKNISKPGMRFLETRRRRKLLSSLLGALEDTKPASLYRFYCDLMDVHLPVKTETVPEAHEYVENLRRQEKDDGTLFTRVNWATANKELAAIYDKFLQAQSAQTA